MKKRNRITGFLAALLCALLLLPCLSPGPVQASQEGIDVLIPVEVGLAQDTHSSAANPPVSTFELTPVDGAPAPLQSTQSVSGEGTVQFDIPLLVPGDYDYLLTPQPFDEEGVWFENSSPIRIHLTALMEEDHLTCAITAYADSDQSDEQAPEAKLDQLRYLVHAPDEPSVTTTTKRDPSDPPDSSDSPKRRKTVSTAADSQIFFWSTCLIASGSAMILLSRRKQDQ